MSAKNRRPRDRTWLQTQFNPDARDRELLLHIPTDMIFRVR